MTVTVAAPGFPRIDPRRERKLALWKRAPGRPIMVARHRDAAVGG